MIALDSGRIVPDAAGWLRSVRAMNRSLLLLTAGALLLLIPVVIDLARYDWSTTAGAQGPIILASGAWLVWRERDSFRFAPNSISGRWLALLGPLLLLTCLAAACTCWAPRPSPPI